MRTLMTVLLLFVLAAHCGAEDRSPFDRNPILDYDQAIKNCEIRGVVITSQFRRVILRCRAGETPAVHEVGDRITVRHDDGDHEFRIEKILPRRVVFRDKKGKRHEVEWQ